MLMIMTYKDNSPTIDESCFIADTATVAGNVEIGKDSSVEQALFERYCV